MPVMTMAPVFRAGAHELDVAGSPDAADELITPHALHRGSPLIIVLDTDMLSLLFPTSQGAIQKRAIGVLKQKRMYEQQLQQLQQQVSSHLSAPAAPFLPTPADPSCHHYLT